MQKFVNDIQMKIAVCGCSHGFLNKIYNLILLEDQKSETKTDVLLCCGDFQAVRNQDDLNELSCPSKYRRLGDFHSYVNGTKTAPLLTLFIGGNHEVVGLAESLRYGGWVAQNIFYLGHSGVVRVGFQNASKENETIRIAGLSGIYKEYDYHTGYYASPPYSVRSLKSCCHIRCQDVFKMAKIQNPLDIVLTHDWPRGIYHFGNLQQLVNEKPFFQTDIQNNTLGNPAATFLLNHLQPHYWFSAHLHTRFSALVKHDTKQTKFLALDKPSPGKRQFLEFFHFPINKARETSCDTSSFNNYPTTLSNNHETESLKILGNAKDGVSTQAVQRQFEPTVFFDEEWLSILSENKHYYSTSPNPHPSRQCDESIVHASEMTKNKIKHQLEHFYKDSQSGELFKWPCWNCQAHPFEQKKAFLDLIDASSDFFNNSHFNLKNHTSIDTTHSRFCVSRVPFLCNQSQGTDSTKQKSVVTPTIHGNNNVITQNMFNQTITASLDQEEIDIDF